MNHLPGGKLAARPLHFIWIADCSGSMSGQKIEQLNFAISEAIPHMRDVANENPNAEVLVRAVKFSDGAQWHVATPTPVANFTWTKLPTGGMTDMGKALRMVAEQMKTAAMPERGLPPVLVLISDGQPTDDFHGGLDALMELPWGKKAVRVAIAIGEDADLDVLQQFIGQPEIKPLLAHNPDQLVKYIKWVSTAVLKAASAPNSQAQNAAGHVPIPAAPVDNGPNGAADVW